MTDRAIWFYLLWCMRPYTGLSPFQYSNGLVLILELLLTPEFHDVPEAGTKINYLTTKGVLENKWRG